MMVELTFALSSPREIHALSGLLGAVEASCNDGELPFPVAVVLCPAKGMRRTFVVLRKAPNPRAALEAALDEVAQNTNEKGVLHGFLPTGIVEPVEALLFAALVASRAEVEGAKTAAKALSMDVIHETRR